MEEYGEKKIFFKKKKGTLREYVEALLTALIVAFFVRSFVIEAFKIPSGSMIPTLMIGDHIFVNKFAYGLRIPLTKKKIVSFGIPQRGEAIVFMYPLDESKDFIKRVVGLPGDKLRIYGDQVSINGVSVRREPIKIAPDQTQQESLIKVIPDATADEMGVHSIPAFKGWEEYQYYVEHIDGVKHLVQFDSQPSYDDLKIEVPPEHLFVMGDNRDNSADSREWGFVPMENVKGRAMFIWLSIDYDRKTLRWDRFGKSIR